MPIFVQEYKWDQTKKFIIIRVPLKGVRHTKADVLISSKYVKVTFEQYYFEMVLPHLIDERKSKATIDKHEVVFELRKTSGQTWKTLEPPQLLKNESLLKKTLMEATWEEINTKDEKRKNIKSELKKLAVRKQIETDTITRENITNNKKKEERQATGEITKWEEDLNNKHKIHQRIRSHSLKTALNATVEQKKLKSERPKNTCDTVEVEFTPRNFPTPKRESTEADEIEFLKKQTETRRAGFFKEDIRLEERNPQFVGAKAKEFMNEKNYYAAASAYTYGIEMDPSSVEFHIGRSRAHFAMGYLHKTLEDCTATLQLLKPYSSRNLKERAECIARRGLVLHKLGLRQYAKEEISFSLELDPNQKLQEFYETANFEDN